MLTQPGTHSAAKPSRGRECGVHIPLPSIPWASGGLETIRHRSGHTAGARHPGVERPGKGLLQQGPVHCLSLIPYSAAKARDHSHVSLYVQALHPPLPSS